jgi:hypothetical protein
MKRINLQQYLPLAGPTVYIVTKLVNDVSFRIGSSLFIAVVKDLCDSYDWHVDITGD